MNAREGRNRDELLAELLWLARDDPRRRQMLAADPELARELAELEGSVGPAVEPTLAELDALGGRLQAPADAGSPAANEADAQLEARALAALRRQLDAQIRRGPTRPRRRWLLLLATTLAAAATVVLLIDSRSGVGQGERGRAPILLGDQDLLDGASPSGQVEQIERFTWSAAPAPGSVQRVRLWYTPDAHGPPSFESDPLTSSEWIPPQEVLEALGREFRWAVFEQDPISGELRRILERRVQLGP